MIIIDRERAYFKGGGGQIISNKGDWTLYTCILRALTILFLKAGLNMYICSQGIYMYHQYNY